MKSLLIFVLIAAGALLWFHEQNDRAQIASAQAENADLTRQLAQKDQALSNAQAQLQALIARQNLPAEETPSALQTGHLSPSGGLQLPRQ